MAALVIGGHQFVVIVHHAGTLLRAGDDAVNGLVNGSVIDEVSVGACGQQRGLVQNIGKVGAGEARGALRDRVEVDVIGQRLAFGVNTQDGLAPLEIRGFNGDLTVKTPRTQQRRIKNIGAVRCGDEDQIRGIIKAIHLNQELVQSLVALIGAAAISRTTVATDGVDFVDEDNRGGNLLCTGDQVTHARGANTDVHFEELGTGNGEEGGIGLSCDCLC